MIKARAHRATQKVSAPGYDDYVEKEPKGGNRFAIGFLLFIMGCVAFIKSCIPFSASATIWISLRLESEVFTPVRKRAWSSAIATLIKELDSGFFMGVNISKNVGFG